LLTDRNNPTAKIANISPIWQIQKRNIHRIIEI